MSLIAKFVSPGDAGGAPRSREWSEAPAAEAPGAPHAEPSSFLHFDLDFGRLASQGFVTPQAVNQSLGNDIRTIKRRLLRRLQFLRRDEGDDRQVRRQWFGILSGVVAAHKGLRYTVGGP